MQPYQRNRLKGEKASNVTGILVTLVFHALALVVLLTSGLKYLDPPPPERTSLLIEFEVEQEPLKPTPTRTGRQPQAETVDVTKPRGERVAVQSMADGSAFDPARTYNVAITSYRASGGGNLLDEIGIDTDRIDERVVARYPEIRNILYDYLKENGCIDPAVVGNPNIIGSWRFVPEKIAAPAVRSDLTLLFGSSK